jgi:hypothetical protein
MPWINSDSDFEIFCITMMFSKVHKWHMNWNIHGPAKFKCSMIRNVRIRLIRKEAKGIKSHQESTEV